MNSALLGQSVHRQIRQMVLSGELAPGRSLSVPALATQLGVSRSPVREAVQQLIYEGLAVSAPHAGAPDPAPVRTPGAMTNTEDAGLIAESVI
ncbi:GntR family transcriptional regulator, partial [Amycolatopsis sp. NPDC003676]